MAESASVADVRTQFEVLQDPESSPGARTEADMWLQQLRNSRAAWEVSFEILADTTLDSPLALFAGQALRHRILTGIHELNSLEMRLEARGSLVTHVIRAASAVPGSAVETQLALAVVALALQMGPTEWANPVEDMANIFGNQVDDASVGLHALLVFLKLFPEEMTNSRLSLDPVTQANASDAWLSYEAAAEVFGLLGGILSDGLASESMGQVAVTLDALAQWIPYVEGPTLAESGLLEAMFDAVKTQGGTVLDAAVKVLMATLHSSVILLPSQLREMFEYDSPEEYEDALAAQDGYMDVVIVVFPQMVELARRFDPESPTAHTVLSLLVQAGISYQPYVQTLASEDTQAYVRFMVDALAFDSSAIASVVTYFWYVYLDTVFMAIDEDEDGGAGLAEAYSEVFGLLTQYLLIRNSMHVASPRLEPERANAGLNDEISHHIASALSSLAQILDGATVLEWVFAYLGSVVGAQDLGGPDDSGRWSVLYTASAADVDEFALRSGLAGLEAVAPFVFGTAGSSPDPLLWLMLSLDAPVLGSTAGIVESMLCVVGAFAPWIGGHPQVLDGVFGYMMMAMEAGLAPLCESAASALCALCIRAHKHMTSRVDAVLSVYGSMVGDPLREQGRTELTDVAAANVVFSVAVLLSSMDPEPAFAGIDTVVEPLVSALGSFVPYIESGSGDAATSAAMVLGLVTRLCVGLQRSRTRPTEFVAKGYPVPVSRVLAQTSELVPQLVHGGTALSSEAGHALVQATLRMVQGQLKASPLDALDLVSSLCSTVVTLYRSVPYSAFMTFINVVVDTYGLIHRPDDSQAQFLAMLAGSDVVPDAVLSGVQDMVSTALFATTEALIQVLGSGGAEAATAHGESLIPFFDMMMFFLVSGPEYLDTPRGWELVRTVYELALGLFALDWDTVARQGVAYVETCASVALDGTADSLPSAAFQSQLMGPLVESYGQRTVSAMLDVLWSQDQGVARIRDLFGMLYFDARESLAQWMQAGLAGVPEQLLSDDDTSRVLSALFNADQPQVSPLRTLQDMATLVQARARS